MRRSKPRRRSGSLVVAGFLSLAVTCAGAGAALADGAPPPQRDGIETTSQPPELQQFVDATVDDLGESLTGGVYVDQEGSVVVTVTSTRAELPASPQSTSRKQVDHSLAELKRIKDSLDQYAAQNGVGAVQTWFVDVPENEVVVGKRPEASDPQTRAFLQHARSLGDAVVVEQTDGGLRPASSPLYNSDTLNLTNTKTCSVGFNARDSQNRQVFITAGHCLVGAPAAYHGSYVGNTAGYRYPGSDYGAVRTDTSAWTPTAAVNKYDGQARPVTGTARPPVGSQVCKSSAISGWTCGTIQAYDQTVNYGNGNLVYGLVRFNACVEPGDSGGAVMYGNSAVGVISGAQFTHTDSGAETCGQRVGNSSVSFYQPIQPALRGMNAQLLTYSNPRN